MTSVISDAEFEDWLEEDGVVRAILVEADFHDGSVQDTEFFSNHAFVSDPSDTPANKDYNDILIEAPEIRTRIGDVTALGEIVVVNDDGEFDTWFDRAWEGWPIKFFLGDVTWFRDDFRLIIEGTNAGIAARSQNRISFAVRDKRQSLSIPVQESLLADGDPIPLSLGECFNIEPALENAANSIYRVHESAVNSITQVRDNGLSVSFTASLAGGAFNLASAATGRITADVTGPTSGTAASIVEFLALRAVSDTSAITSANINVTSLATFPNTAQLGLYVDRQERIGSLIDDVLHSLGGFAFFNRLGNLELSLLTVPGSTAVASLNVDDIIIRGFTLVDLEQPDKQLRLGYHRNFTVQDRDGLASGVTEANRDLFGKEFSIVSAVNSGITDQFPLATTAPIKKTLIVNSADAQTEVDRLRDIRAEKRKVFTIESFVRPFNLRLGDTISVTHSRFGFSSGSNVTIIGTIEFPLTSRVDLEVWQ